MKYDLKIKCPTQKIFTMTINIQFIVYSVMIFNIYQLLGTY